jgi:hypothetical protein
VEPGASYITIENLQFIPSPQAMATMLALGAANSTQASADLAPQHILVDRVLADVPDGLGQLRGIALNSAHTRIANSHLAGFKAAGVDSQAIASWNGPGPFAIENNYLEGAGENILFGGGDPATPGLVPTGIWVRWNHMVKPVKWRGLSWTVKNTFELKNAQDVLVEGNLLEYNWRAAQDGYSIVFTPRNQEGGAPHTVVQRVRVQNNWVRHVSSVFNILGRDNNHPTLQTNDIEIRNNVFEDVSYSNWGGHGRLMLVEGTENLRLVHNTSLNTGSAIVTYGNPSYGFVLENNVLNYGTNPEWHYGIIGDNTAPGNATIAQYFPGGVVLGNVMPNNVQPWRFPSGNQYPPTWDDVGFVDFAGGDFRLAETSAYVAAGTNGQMPGARIDSVVAAMAAPVAPPTCAVALAPSAIDVDGAGETVALAITSNYGFCEWTLASAESWAAVTPAQGSGSGTVALTVESNPSPNARTAIVSLGAQTVTISQGPGTCTFTRDPTSYAAPASGGVVDVTLAASASTCAWTALSDQPWVTVDAANGTGSSTVRITVSPNTASTSRAATVTVAGGAVSVTQSGAEPLPPACTFTVTPTSYSTSAAAASFQVSVTASAPDCSWTATSVATWLTLGTSGGTGSAAVTVDIAENTGAATRNTKLVIAGHTISVQQSGRPKKK